MNASILNDSFRGPRSHGIPCSFNLSANASISGVVKWGIMPTPLGSPFFSKSHTVAPLPCGSAATQTRPEYYDGDSV